MPDKFPDMKYRTLGLTGLQISVIGFGGWLTSHGGTAFDCIQWAYDLGVNFFDTAEGHPAALSETFLGQAIKRFGWKQTDLVISTKIFQGSVSSRLSPDPPSDRSLARKHILEGMEDSLRRLDLPYVDIVYAHEPDPGTPMEEIVRAFNHLINAGKTIYWGTYDWSLAQITDAVDTAEKLHLVGPAAHQPEYSLLARDRVAFEYTPLYSEEHYGLTTHSPLRKGILTGKYNIVTSPPPGSRLAKSRAKFIEEYRKTFGDEAWEKDAAKVDKLREIATDLGVSVAQLSIAWTLSNGDVSCVITGASRVDQVMESIRALEVLPRLTDDTGLSARIREVTG
ncbi:NADP-dependent oxidoreductase domain-containing protein [Aspergillus carlsbadensis]|nr:NADP-dependent oxidoreductase domain-containing protein [Aspergillus carlsbadensis]